MNKLEKIAQKEMGITLEQRMSDGLDFYENNESSIPVWNIQKALQSAYDEGKKDAIKVTKIKYANDHGYIEVGRKLKINNKDYMVVGYFTDCTVFACLNPKNLEEARVIIFTDSEIDELISLSKKAHLKIIKDYQNRRVMKYEMLYLW